MTNKYGEPWPSRIEATASRTPLNGGPIFGRVWMGLLEYERARACVNACAGVAEMGSVRELVEAVANLLNTPLRDADGDIPWAYCMADKQVQACLANFRLEADHAK